MAFSKNIRLASGAVGLGVALQRIGAFQGQFNLPAVSVDSLLDVYLPGVAGAAAIVPNINIPKERLVIGLTMAALAVRTLVQQGRAQFTFENILEGYAPAALAALIFMG